MCLCRGGGGQIETSSVCVCVAGGMDILWNFFETEFF